MPEPALTVPRTDHRVARRARGILRDGTTAGLIVAADAHVADRLGQLVGEDDEHVLLALALAVRAVRTGSVACDLATIRAVDPDFGWPDLDGPAWLDRVAASPLSAAQVTRIEFGLLYLDRYWQQERAVAGNLRARAALPPPEVDEPLLTTSLDRLFPDPRDADQRRAAGFATRNQTTIVTGGPGTGKTTVIARILALLAQQATSHRPEQSLRVALAAPTAKAATRLGEAVATATAGLPADLRSLVPSVRASTLHRLLGWTPQSRSRFRHNRDNRLPHDVVIIDEASMISLTLMSRLLEALRPTTRLIIVGDPDQLASVEAGAVLADLVAGLDAMTTGEEATSSTTQTTATTPATALPVTTVASPRRATTTPSASLGAVARLRHTYRFGGAIDALAQAIRDGDADKALSVLTAGDPTVSLLPDPADRRGLMVEGALAAHRHAVRGEATDALAALSAHRLLCAHRSGPFGVSHWNRRIEQWISQESGEAFRAPMYAGRPLLVTTNDYGLDLYNGDTGVVLVRDGRLVAAFDSGTGVREVAAARLSDVETMYAATVHKSQGSQARRVTVLLPELDSPLLTRELLYTAVTRAQEEIAVIGTPEVVRAALDHRIQRASGLRQRLIAP